MGNRITRLAATACLAVVAAAALAAAPSVAAPRNTSGAGGTDLASARPRVSRLYHRAELASERYNNARDQLAQASRRLGIARADLQTTQATVRRLRQEVATAVVAQYQGQALSSVKLLFSKDPNTFLAGLAAVSQLDRRRSEMAAAFVVRSRQLALRREQARRVQDQMARTEHRMAADQAAIQARLKAAEGLLTRLKQKAAAAAAARAARRAARQAAQQVAARQKAAAKKPSRSASRPPVQPPPAPAGSPQQPGSGGRHPAPHSAGVGRAAIAVRYALAQVGDAYVYGAAGPTAFDCSGLTMMAWRAAGVSLPHNAAAQMGYGTPVAISALRPGDLVFYYSPVSHVGLYIGHGKIVNAENPSVGVVVAPVGLMPVAGAVRVG